MTTLLQISDAHFGTEQPPVVQALLQLARDQAPDLVVMSGDITQRARRSQFKAARAFIDQLKPAALLTIPGNHDIPLFNLALRVFAPYSNYSRAFGKNLEPLFESANLLVMLKPPVDPLDLRPQRRDSIALRQRIFIPAQRGGDPLPVWNDECGDKRAMVPQQYGLPDEGLVFQLQLDEAGIDVRAVGAVKNVLLLADDSKRAVGIEDAEIAAMKPAVFV